MKITATDRPPMPPAQAPKTNTALIVALVVTIIVVVVIAVLVYRKQLKEIAALKSLPS